MRSLIIGSALALAACASTSEGVAPPEILEIPANGMAFDALAAGPEDGELVLLLHGFPQTSYSFRSQIPVLAAAGYRAVAVDQRGYSPGARPDGVEAYALARLVEDVAAIADALGRDRFHVVGHDWGAAVAWFTAMAHPKRVITVSALSVPHPFAFSQAAADPDGDQAKASAYMADLRADGAEETLLADDAAMLRGVYGPVVDPDAVDVYVEALGTPEALGAALNWYRAMGVLAPFANLTPIELPTLYVWSTDDATMSRTGAELTANFVKGPYRFEVLEGVGHWIPEEAATRVNELLLEHLASASTGE